MGSSSQIFEYFMVCGLVPETQTLHNTEEMYMPAFWTTTSGPVRMPLMSAVFRSRRAPYLRSGLDL
jgi:hypothetical protein